MASNNHHDWDIEGEIGRKQAGFLKGPEAASRIHGMLTARGRQGEWEEAFKHISLHFSPDPSKKTHTVFRKKYRNSDALKQLIKQAVSKPSTTRISRLTIAGFRVGGPCALIIRRFAEPIGTNDDEICLIVVVDREGNLMSAYPKTMEGAALKG